MMIQKIPNFYLFLLFFESKQKFSQYFCPKLFLKYQIGPMTMSFRGSEPLFFKSVVLFREFRTVPGLKSFWGYQKWKVHKFLHRNYIPICFSTSTKNIFSSSKKKSGIFFGPMFFGSKIKKCRKIRILKKIKILIFSKS